MIEVPKLGTDHPVFTILLEENPGLFTTEGLEGLLMDCARKTVNKDKIAVHHSLVHECVWTSLSSVFESPGDLDLMRRILVSPSEFDLETPKELIENHFYKKLCVYKKLSGLFSSDMMTNKFVYDVIRDNIHTIQKQLNISGIKQRHESMCDRLISFWTSSGQLQLLESDKVVLSQEIPKVVDFFLFVCSIDNQYELFIEDDNERLHPCEESKIRAIAQIAVDASIRCESNEWVKVADNRWRGSDIKRLYPDKITLYFGLPEDETEVIEAIHVDKTRKPWFVEEEANQ